MKFLIAFFIFSTLAYGNDCPEIFGHYGESRAYQDMFCKILVRADTPETTKTRNFVFNEQGLIQVYAEIDNSDGFRVYYLFPIKTKQNIDEADDQHLSATLASGVVFNFDKAGIVSSSQISMKVSDISHKNKGGIEIERFPDGLVVDLGYRIGKSPLENLKSKITIIDKNNKKCVINNNELHRSMSDDDVELRYKTNDALYEFFSKRCPGLDVSDLKTSMP
jgi:hypothetical protein